MRLSKKVLTRTRGPNLWVVEDHVATQTHNAVEMIQTPNRYMRISISSKYRAALVCGDLVIGWFQRVLDPYLACASSTVWRVKQQVRISKCHDWCLVSLLMLVSCCLPSHPEEPVTFEYCTIALSFSPLYYLVLCSFHTNCCDMVETFSFLIGYWSS